MIANRGLWVCSIGLGVLVACGGDDDDHADTHAHDPDAAVDAGHTAPREHCVADESAPPAPRDSYAMWTKVELPGTTCSDGSQYKFFVNYSNTTNNLIVIFEPGGACWDYESCSGGGARGAANPNGIPDDHMSKWEQVHPHSGGLVGGDGEFAMWNRVFVPYCTGDVHSGSKTITYTSDDGKDKLEYRHVGRDNMKLVADWLADTFTTVPRMVVTGCSAGGAGAFLNYPLLRSRVEGAQCGYLLNDSGPIFPSDGPSKQLHQKIRDSWNTDAIIDDYGELFGEEAADAVRADFGALNTVVADAYPKDRLAVTLYQRDLNYSLYSYDTFFDHPPYETIVSNWETDVAALRALYDSRDNLAYYIPYYRESNCSHCSTIIPVDFINEVFVGTMGPWSGTEIAEVPKTMPEFIAELTDDEQELHSYFETKHTDGEFTQEKIAECRK